MVRLGSFTKRKAFSLDNLEEVRNWPRKVNKLIRGNFRGPTGVIYLRKELERTEIPAFPKLVYNKPGVIRGTLVCFT